MKDGHSRQVGPSLFGHRDDGADPVLLRVIDQQRPARTSLIVVGREHTVITVPERTVDGLIPDFAAVDGIAFRRRFQGAALPGPQVVLDQILSALARVVCLRLEEEQLSPAGDNKIFQNMDHPGVPVLDEQFPVGHPVHPEPLVRLVDINIDDEQVVLAVQLHNTRRFLVRHHEHLALRLPGILDHSAPELPVRVRSPDRLHLHFAERSLFRFIRVLSCDRPVLFGQNSALHSPCQPAVFIDVLELSDSALQHTDIKLLHRREVLQTQRVVVRYHTVKKTAARRLQCRLKDEFILRVLLINDLTRLFQRGGDQRHIEDIQAAVLKEHLHPGREIMRQSFFLPAAGQKAFPVKSDQPVILKNHDRITADDDSSRPFACILDRI